MSMFNYGCDEVKKIIDEVSPNYPQLTTFEKEWLYFHKYGYIPGVPVDLECATVETSDRATVLDAIPFNYKSAILKGNTLVNLIDLEKFTSPKNLLYVYNLPVINNTTYTVIATLRGSDKIDTRTDSAFRIKANTENGDDLINNQQITSDDFSTIINLCQTIKITNQNNLHIRIYNILPENLELIIIEGDHTQEDIPYFEGMKSVQMPVLTTTGKNLFNINSPYQTTSNGTITNNALTVDGGNGNNFNYIAKYKIPLANGDIEKQYTISSMRTGNGKIEIRQYDKNDKELNVKLMNSSTTITIVENACYITLTFSARQSSGLTTWTNIQVEESPNATPYETFKSNILTVNEDVELRGVGDVQDTLDLMTGELTERFVEVVLDGSEDWSVNNSNNDGFYSCSTNTYTGKPNGAIISDKLLTISSTKAEGVMLGMSTGKVMVSFNRESSGVSNLNSFKEKLAQNPITILYELATESVKTVKLTDKLSKPYEGTNYYETYSDTIQPIMFLEVPVVSKGNKTLLDIQNQD